MEIIPAIIGANYLEVEEKILQAGGLTDWIQLDIMDGQFVPSVSWQIPDDLRELDGRTKIEVHLMVENPEEVVIEWQKVTDRILVHVESTDRLAELVNNWNGPTELALAIDLETPISTLEPYALRLKRVQLMGIKKIGYQGESLEEGTFDKIRQLKAEYPHLKVQIDGGVTLDNAKMLKEAGADGLVVGSALWKSGDISKTIEQFKNL